MAKQPRVWTGTQWDTLAVTLPDLSNYSTTTQMNTAIDNAKGLVYITGASFSATTTVSINNCFSATYDFYRIVLSLKADSNNTGVNMRMRASGTDATGSNYRNSVYRFADTTANGYQNADATANSFALPSIDIYNYAQISFDITNPFLARRTRLSGIASGSWSGTSELATIIFGNSHELANSYDGFTLLPGTASTGTIRVYGYRNS